jgi:probable HAF family extracellular repeat protein
MTDLGTLPGEMSSQATSINNAGEITGSSTPIFQPFHAFLYRDNAMRSLDAVPGSYSAGYGIINGGQVTGIYLSGGASHGFLYSNGQIVDLGKDTVGSALNDSWQITGNITTAVPSGPIYFRHAFLYSNGQMTHFNDLIDPTLGLTLFSANAINEHGPIVADGYRLLVLAGVTGGRFIRR